MRRPRGGDEEKKGGSKEQGVKSSDTIERGHGKEKDTEMKEGDEARNKEERYTGERRRWYKRGVERGE